MNATRRNEVASPTGLLAVLIAGLVLVSGCKNGPSSQGSFPTMESARGVAGMPPSCPPDGSRTGTLEDMLLRGVHGMLMGTIVSVEPEFEPVWSLSEYPPRVVDPSTPCTETGHAALRFRLLDARASWGDIPSEVEVIISNNLAPSLRPMPYLQPGDTELTWDYGAERQPDGTIRLRPEYPPPPGPGLRIALMVRHTVDGEYYFDGAAYNVEPDGTVVEKVGGPCWETPELGELTADEWFDRLQTVLGDVELHTFDPMPVANTGLRCPTH